MVYSECAVWQFDDGIAVTVATVNIMCVFISVFCLIVLLLQCRVKVDYPVTTQ